MQKSIVRNVKPQPEYIVVASKWHLVRHGHDGNMLMYSFMCKKYSISLAEQEISKVKLLGK